MAQTDAFNGVPPVFRSLATRRRLMLAALGVAAALPALADGNEPMLTIRGELTYLQRIALPGDAVATVEMKPAGAADDASATAGTRIALEGRQVPVAFSLEVPRAHLDAGTAYVLHGAIEVDSRPRWLSGPVEVDTAAASVDVGTIRLSQQQEEPATADEDDEARPSRANGASRRSAARRSPATSRPASPSPRTPSPAGCATPIAGPTRLTAPRSPSATPPRR
jgi:uncharacterized lipoprotein YbaY